MTHLSFEKDLENGEVVVRVRDSALGYLATIYPTEKGILILSPRFQKSLNGIVHFKKERNRHGITVDFKDI